MVTKASPPDHLLTKTGLRSARDPRDRITDSKPEVEDLDVGPVGDFILDLDL